MLSYTMPPRGSFKVCWSLKLPPGGPSTRGRPRRGLGIQTEVAAKKVRLSYTQAAEANYTKPHNCKFGIWTTQFCKILLSKYKICNFVVLCSWPLSPPSPPGGGGPPPFSGGGRGGEGCPSMMHIMAEGV